MANLIQLRRSAVQGAVPTTAQLQLGELAINTYDGKLYLKKNNGTESIVEIGAGGGASISIGDTAPASPINGSLWWDSTAGKLKIYYNDGTTSQWVDASSNTYGSGGVSSTSIASDSTITPTVSVTQYNVTALAVAATIAAPTGTPVDGQKLMLRIKDNGTARALTWTTTSGAYRAIGSTLPTNTTAGKLMYIGCVYNANIVTGKQIGRAHV